MRARVYSVVFVAFLGGFGVVALTGCGSSDDKPLDTDAAAIEDAGATADTTPTAPDDAVPDTAPPPLDCTSKVTAPIVTLTYVAFMKLKPATGGTIVDGHYVLTSGSTTSSYYQRAAELWIRDGRFEYQSKSSSRPGSTQYSYGGKLTPEGTRFKTTVDCGNQGAMPNFYYSVKGSQLLLQFTNISGIRYLYRFDRQ